jgi:membrane-associated phospholipid phosphatase
VRTRHGEPVRNRSAEYLILLVTTAIIVVATVPAERGLTAVERWVFEAINGLPSWPWLEWPVRFVMQVGAFFALPIIAAVAFVLKRVRLGVAVLVSGGAAYLLARLAKDFVARARPAAFFPPDDIVVRGNVQQGLGFPSGHSAVAAAVVCAAIPYLVWRYKLWLLFVPIVVAFGRIYVGAHLPLDVLAGMSIGIAIAIVYHLVIQRAPQAVGDPDVDGPGSPTRDPAPTERARL